ncbi:hypothetical protein RRG08_055632 [Elysia crispata]|uniref:Uncharacterized protein n=1 Tax=Elysia crispata TaxID=231223 RepID=A0AAE0Z806_9GAST|nr:hypothetical protein RRG08_055632 [Elysia crispata]
MSPTKMAKVKREATRVGISKAMGRADNPLVSLSIPSGSDLRASRRSCETSAGSSSRLRAVVDPDLTRAWSVEALAPPPGMVTSGRPLGKKRLFGKPNSMEGSWQEQQGGLLFHDSRFVARAFRVSKTHHGL